MFSTFQVPRFVVRGYDPAVFARPAPRRAAEQGATTPAIGAPLSVWEDAERVYVEVDVPGLQPQQVDVHIEDGKLLISGERAPARRDQRCWYEERAFGRFARAIALPEAVDPSQVDANLRDGVLSITLHKRPEAQPHRVAVKYAAESTHAASSPGEAPSSNGEATRN
jgi:HSP20 family protein